jgi:hypothetical protein
MINRFYRVALYRPKVSQSAYWWIVGASLLAAASFPIFN